MRYHSTRGQVKGLTFEEALYTGYADDGGILLPDNIPVIDRDTLRSWAGLTYIQLAKIIIPYFISEEEIPRAELNELLDNAFSRFRHPDIAPIKKCRDGLNVMELFHGVTWAFKDLALSCVGQFLQYFLSKRKKHLTILVGTSGDTGSAAIEAVRGMKYVDIIVFLPRGRCTKIQELQMTTVLEDNVHVFRCDGSSDDLDIPIKACFQDTEFCHHHNLSSINSINWARIMVQAVHYIYGYLQMCPECDRDVEFVIPTGACGNVTSGFIAQQMGVPIKFVCAVTQNDIVARTVKNGEYKLASEVIQTLAPAMDIQIPYNMERIWSILTNNDTQLVKGLMEKFERDSAVKVPDDLTNKVREVIVDTYVATDEDVKVTMKRVFTENDYLVCPHTAVGVAYHYKQMRKESESGTKALQLIIATASVAKFDEAMKAAELRIPQNDDVNKLMSLPTRYQDLEKDQDWLLALRSKIEQITKQTQS